MREIKGIHHVTAIAGPAQENLDFYAGVLGLRLVKKSVNQDDPGTYHLFYADAEGHPGTDLTFFPWAQMAPSREGYGLSSEVSLAVPPGSLGFWSGRLRTIRRRDGRGRSALRSGYVLPVIDPHGLRIALVESEDSLGPRFHSLGRKSDPGGTSDSWTGERADGRARSCRHDVVPFGGDGFHAPRHGEWLASLRCWRREIRFVCRSSRNADGESRRLGHRQHSSPRVARGRRSPSTRSARRALRKAARIRRQ